MRCQDETRAKQASSCAKTHHLTLLLPRFAWSSAWRELRANACRSNLSPILHNICGAILPARQSQWPPLTLMTAPSSKPVGSWRPLSKALRTASKVFNHWRTSNCGSGTSRQSSYCLPTMAAPCSVDQRAGRVNKAWRMMRKPKQRRSNNNRTARSPHRHCQCQCLPHNSRSALAVLWPLSCLAVLLHKLAPVVPALQ